MDYESPGPSFSLSKTSGSSSGRALTLRFQLPVALLWSGVGLIYDQFFSLVSPGRMVGFPSFSPPLHSFLSSPHDICSHSHLVLPLKVLPHLPACCRAGGTVEAAQAVDLWMLCVARRWSAAGTGSAGVRAWKASSGLEFGECLPTAWGAEGGRRVTESGEKQ